MILPPEKPSKIGSKEPGNRQNPTLQTASQEAVSLYFHIPFCTKKCPYCHFYVVPNRPLFHRVLEEGLELEWERQKPLLVGKTITSVYFGGGTPSLFAPNGIRTLLKRIPLQGPCEITLEANPEELTPRLLDELLAIGVNRLSLGVQSLDDRSLQVLERIHSASKAKNAIWDAKKAGFSNISIDLMYDLPDQTRASWEYTLSQLEELPFQHLSLYNLTIEPHTSFFKRKEELTFPDAEDSLALLNAAIRTMEKKGFHRYEISAFCQKGFESHHNLGYWTFRPFLGFGPSAFSFWNGTRFRNTSHLQRYTRALKEGLSPVDFEETLLYPRNIQEEIAIGLRLFQGVEKKPSWPLAVQESIDRWMKEGFLEKIDTRIRLTEKGSLFYDTIASDLV